MGIGERLREARLRQKIDIADVEAATKIRAKYLRALENEEFGLLPGSTFAKTFLRTYADYLGLDAQLLVEEYRVQHEPRGEEVAPIGATSGGGRPRRGGPGIGAPGPGAVFGLVVLLLVAFILVLGLTGEDPEEENAGQQDTSEQARDERREAAEARKRRRERRARAERRRRQRREASVVRLRLVPSEPVYACVVDGSGEQLFGGTLEEPRNFRGRRIRINLGRTSVRVVVNGRALRIAPSSDPIGYDLRAGRRPQSLPLGQRPNC